MPTPAPSVPTPDFITPLIVGVPEQILKIFTSSPLAVAMGLFILSMLVFGPYLKAKKQKREQKEREEKRAALSSSRKSNRQVPRNASKQSADAVSKKGNLQSKEQAALPVSEYDSGNSDGLVHKQMWSPVGPLTLISDGGLLAGIYHEGQSNYPEDKDLGVLGETPVIAEAERQLNEYFAGERVKFNLTLKEDAPTFDRNVWVGVSKIPYGETRTVEQLVESIGYKPNSVTYVSGAVMRNRFAIVVPSHRIVPAKGSGKYVGGTVNKDSLLNLERK